MYRRNCCVTTRNPFRALIKHIIKAATSNRICNTHQKEKYHSSKDEQNIRRQNKRGKYLSNNRSDSVT